MTEQTAHFGASRCADNSDYLIVAVEPKDEPVQRYRISRGGADVLAAELLGALRTQPQAGSVEQVERDAVLKAAEPWADFHGDIPDYDHPLRPVFESGIQYAVELLAKELGVEDYDICDGTEEFDGDLGGTLLNIVRATWPTDEHGDWLDLRDPQVRQSLQPDIQSLLAGERDGLRTRLDRIVRRLEDGLKVPPDQIEEARQFIRSLSGEVGG